MLPNIRSDVVLTWPWAGASSDAMTLIITANAAVHLAVVPDE
jgi:hypothetical protein